MLPSKKTPLDFPFRHSGNPDKYGQSLGGDFTQVQANFDKRAEFNQTQINAILDALASVTDGDSGADNVKATPLTGGTADTVQGILEELKASEGTLDGQNVKLTGNQTVNDIKTFTSSPIVPTPTTSSQAASKSYVDATVGAVVLGQIPDGSLTDVKLSDTTGQIKDRVSVLRTDVDKLELETEYNNKAIAEMQMFLELESKIPSKDNNKFYTNFIDSFIASAGVVDLTTQNYTGTLSSGATSVTVTSATGFAKGQEISIQNNVSYEDVIIDSVVGNTINFKTPLVNTYTNPRIYRSNNNTTGFGTSGQISVTYDKTTPVTAASGDFTTQGNGGRKQVRLSNGWLIAGKYDSSGSGYIKFQKSTDNGNTWSQICYITAPAPANFAIASIGTKVYVLKFYSALRVRSNMFDAVTQGDVDLGIGSDVDVSQAEINSCSLTIGSDGNLHGAWASKNATYPNQFNLRYAKGTINGDGSVTWGTVEQLTTENTTGDYHQNPCVVPLLVNGKPVIFAESKYTTNYYIRAMRWSGSVWNYTTPPTSTYQQRYPSATVDSNGDCHVTWHGLDATDASTENIRYSKVTGVGSWSPPVKLTTGNAYAQVQPSIAVDSNNDLHVAWHGLTATNPTYANIRLIKSTSGTWGAITEVTAQNTVAITHPSLCDNFKAFEKPLMIYKEGTTAIKFYGKWTEISDSPVIKNVIRININPYINCTEAQAWLTKSELAGFTVDGKVSFKALITDDESYIDLVETITDLGSTNEISMTGVSAVPSKHITLKLILERSSTSDVVSFTKLVGGVA